MSSSNSTNTAPPNEEMLDDILSNLSNPMNNTSQSSDFGSYTPANSTSKTPIDLLKDPMFISVAILCAVLIIGIIIYLGNDTKPDNSIMRFSTNTQTSPSSNMEYYGMVLLGICATGLVLYVLYYILQTYFNIDISSTFKKATAQTSSEFDIDLNQSTESSKPAPTPVPAPTPFPTPVDDPKQVFNIPDNAYTYDDAKSLCKAFGAELADYEQIENAYNNGGEWCNYGWSKNQLALYPTQLSTYNNLQSIEGHQHDCGRPGINGGYIDNQNIRFGVNCYGIKPPITTEDEERMQNVTPYPKNQQEVEMEQQVSQWKNRLSEIIVSPFNYNQWQE